MISSRWPSGSSKYAAATVEVVDLAAPVAVEIGIEGDTGALDTGERSVEFTIADEKGVMLPPKIGGFGKVQGNAVFRPEWDEMRHRSCSPDS